jgi:hypothetical protein
MWAYCCLLYKYFIDFALTAQYIAQPHIPKSHAPKAGVALKLSHFLDILLKIDSAVQVDTAL